METIRAEGVKSRGQWSTGECQESLRHRPVTKVGHDGTDKITRSAVTAEVSRPHLRHTHTHKREKGVWNLNTLHRQ